MSRPAPSSPPAAAAAAAADADAVADAVADRSPGSDVSPMTRAPEQPPNDAASTPTQSGGSYFAPSAARTGAGTDAGSRSDGRRSETHTDASGETATTTTSSSTSAAVPSPTLNTTTPTGTQATATATATLSFAGEAAASPRSRQPSTASVSFRSPANPALPQGQPKQARIQSPAPKRFRKHVGFDNIPLGEATKSNTLGYTLSISHYGYHPRRRSRTVMVGFDHQVYSDFALQWLLDEYADDGDEVICVHVVDKDARSEEKSYKARAEKMVERIKSKIPDNCAISITLEYAVGKLHATFQKLIQVYQPSMLVVGTRGRSLGGFQGLVNTNSFSKYCLQYSPVPTVVVRDYEKRQKKKEKRSNDPARHSYAAMLAATNGVHEANSESSSLYDMEARISPDEEAHRVASAIGLPAAFDPIIKPLDIDQYLGRRLRTGSPARSEPQTAAAAAAAAAAASASASAHAAAAANAAGLSAAADVARHAAPSPLAQVAVAVPTAASVDSEDDESADDDEPEPETEFEVTAGGQALQAAAAAKETEKEQRKRLHEMEVGEAAALKHVVESDDEEDDEGSTGGGSKG